MLRIGSRQRPLELIERRARLQRCDGVNQIGDRFGLNQIDLAVQKGAERELTGLRQPCPCVDGAPNDRGENDRAAVRRDLGDVFTGVGVWGRKEGDNEAIAADRV